MVEDLVQKSQRVDLSYLPQEWSWGFQRLLSLLKYYNVLKVATFEAPSPTPGRDRHMRVLTFLYAIESLTTFI